MDDQQSYLLSGLLRRHFSLGRILRFREVARGSHAETYEVLTAEQHEFLLHLYPAALPAERLEFMAGTVNALDAERFSVVPFVPSPLGRYAVEGPQNRHMLVSLLPAGGMMSGQEFTEHDISQLGLRLAWMHRLFKQQIKAGPAEEPLSERIRRVKRPASGGGPERAGALLTLLSLPVELNWAHGDIQPAALLHDEDHQLRTIVDWSRLHAGSPLEDVVDAFVWICGDGKGQSVMRWGRVLLEAYDSLSPIRKVAWSPVVGHWLARRWLDSLDQHREPPPSFSTYLAEPERLTTLLASCL